MSLSVMNPSFADGKTFPEIRLYNDFNLPLDPSTLFSMSEYNLSLCIFSTIFEMGSSSIPESHVLESWRFNAAGSFYDFIIKKNVLWSDLKPLTAADLKESIVRLKSVAPSHYHSIMSLVAKKEVNERGILEDGLEIVSDSHLRIYVSKPKPDLFARLTGVFIPIIRNDLLDPKNLRVTRHDVTLAPYAVDYSVTNKNQLFLKKNTVYFKTSESMANIIEMRPYKDRNPKAEDVLDVSTWPNLILDRSFTSELAWQRLKSQKMPIWTRPVDRVLYIYPTKHAHDREDILATSRWLGRQLTVNPIEFSDYPGIKPARSLQPKGFFLYDAINFDEGSAPKSTKIYNIAIANSQIPGKFLIDEFGKRGLKARFEQFPVTKMKEVLDYKRFDFVVASVGAADPDPVTWLSLILGGDLTFIADYERVYRKEFESIKSEKDASDRVSRLRALIRKAGERGLYIPLAHFSSIATATPDLDLSLITEADETVNLSRVIVKRNGK